ncbi:hypothetical protein ACXOYL_06905 [Streptococcus thermophilus]|uniref:Uncharacterized protein n=1 Tax=Streptococcus thermophilus TaxID=1308 RepID=A0A8D6XRD7_STRTR|nr:hypothetical protein [Streptococcus thermophilus]MDA3770394.1 hypothetical protein [Streptococcus thermophilus]CAD0137323.1 protein of unknown function [Streptococcus thermophilus]
MLTLIQRWLYLTKLMHKVKQQVCQNFTWSDDLYNSATLLHAKNISHRYNSDGIVYRRESDGSVVFVTFS